MKGGKDPNDNAVTRLIALFLVLLLLVAVVSVIAGISFWMKTGHTLAEAQHSDYSVGAGLCFLAAIGALGTGLLGLAKVLTR